MMRNSLIVVLLACSACSDPTPTAVEPASPKPESTPAATIPQAQAAAHVFTFMTLSDEVPNDPRILRVEESPCGPLVEARVANMPLNDPALLADLVVEFKPDGSELQRWGKPNEAELVGLEGERLLFAVGAERYWTTPDGGIGSLGAVKSGEGTELLTQQAMFACPALPGFGNSESVQCFRIGDAAGQTRLIALEGVCS
ncbi:MAG: hypothetical protein DI635_06825 [Pseudoxanthomonas suwonensis]|nr:MAG: hypothetical protein DI635_06825 [Pseudoxanthomonas suwonensis]